MPNMVLQFCYCNEGSTHIQGCSFTNLIDKVLLFPPENQNGDNGRFNDHPLSVHSLLVTQITMPKVNYFLTNYFLTIAKTMDDERLPVF